jgi:hypothetical protein
MDGLKTATVIEHRVGWLSEAEGEGAQRKNTFTMQNIVKCRKY